MAEVIGKIQPDSEVSVSTAFESLDDLNQARATLAASLALCKEIETGEVPSGEVFTGIYLVRLDDGRATHVSHSGMIGKEQEE